MIGHIMDSGENEESGLYLALIRVVTLSRVHIGTILVGGCDTYNFEINGFEIELILNCIL